MYNIYCMIVCYTDGEENFETVIGLGSSGDMDHIRETMKQELINFKQYTIHSAVLYKQISKIM